MAPEHDSDSGSSTRRIATALAIAAASALLHLLLIAWLGERGEFSGAPGARSPEPVEVSLIARPEPAPAQQPDRAEANAQRPPSAPARRRPAPEPRPDAITPPAPASPGPVVADPVEAVADAAHGEAGGHEGGATGGETQRHEESPPAAPASASAASESASEQASAGAASPLFGKPLPLPPAGQWKFEVYYGDFTERHQVASLDYSIAHDGSRYRLRTEGRAEGLTALLYSGVLTQTSVGRLGDDGLAPERYTEQRGRRAERWAAVDHAAGRVTFSGGPPSAPVPGLQDRLSALVQVGLIARALPERLAAGQVIEVPELTLKAIETVRYASRGDEALVTEHGTLRTLRLERRETVGANDPKVEVWLGYDRGMLPVRIRLTDAGGRVLDQLSAQ